MKYELTTKTVKYFGETLYRIRALKDIPPHGVKKGDLGGFVESEKNLSQDGDCWISGNAIVFRDALVSENALVYEYAMVHGNAQVLGNARVYGNAEVCANSLVGGYARVYGDFH